jgi:Tfp pilus assembly protein PilF
VQLLEATARLSPKPETLLALARLQLRNPMWSNRALDNLRRAVTLAPRLTEGWLDLASYWAARSELTKASRCYERVLTYDPTNEEARKRLEAQTKGGSSWWTFRSR